MGAHTLETFAPDARQVMDSLRGIVQVLRRFDREAERRVRLTGAQVFVLGQLRDGEVISINELAARTHTHQSSVSVVAQKLVDRGLAQRSRSAVDGRRVEVSITATGQRLLGRTPPAAQEKLIEALRRLPAAQRKRLASDLFQLVRIMGIETRLPPLFFEEKGNQLHHE